MSLSNTLFTSIFFPVAAISPTTPNTCSRLKPMLPKSTIMRSSGTAPDVCAALAGGGGGGEDSIGVYAGYAVGYTGDSGRDGSNGGGGQHGNGSQVGHQGNNGGSGDDIPF